MTSARFSFVATVCMCAALAGGTFALVYAQTAGLEDWTFEAQRRRDVRSGSVIAPAVSLSDDSSAQWRLWPNATKGAVYVIDFIYTRCPGMCQGLGSQFRAMQREVQRQGAAGSVHLVSISFDLAHDTSEALAEYARIHGADDSIWRVSRPNDAADSQRLLRALGIVAVDDGMGGYIHNSSLHVIDGQGLVRGLYDYGNWQDAVEHALELARRD